MDFNLSFNEEQGQFEGQFKAVVTSLGSTVQKNVNGTEYVVGAIKFTNASGQEVERSAICYMKNLDKGITVGESYLCNVAVTEARPNEPIISISPLTSAVRATSEDFNFDFAAAMAEQGVGAEQIN